MKRLSLPLDALKAHYDVVVVGSGYGGAIAASRLARTGKSICLLERGPERRAGDFPDNPFEASAEVQTHSKLCDTGVNTALFDFHVGDDIAVLTGCGLGGTSLINANVSLRPDVRVLDDPIWPAEIRADRARLDDCYAMAEEMLGANQYPDDWPKLEKYRALQRSGEKLQLPVYKTRINVTFADGQNHAGVEQNKCVLCGDCVTGCNHDAKNATVMNYLPDAEHHGAEIFTCAAVSHLERRAEGGWVVHIEARDVGRERFNAPALCVSADVVVLGAGALGSTEILLRSRERGLALSANVGKRFSGNGDVIGFAYNADQPVHGVGTCSKTPAPGHEVGPCITGVIDGRATIDVNDGFIIEEGDVPGPVGVFTPLMYDAAGPFIGEQTSSTGRVGRALQTAESNVLGAYQGAADRTQTFLIMSHDNSGGELSLDEKDRLTVSWPGVGLLPHFKHMDDQLRTASAGVNAVYYRNPMWTKLLGDRLITVHALGGSVMGESAESGAVNHKGQVFNSSSGTAVWDDLYVTCGAALPRSVGVNPLITISAVAERNVGLLAADRGWTIDYSRNTGKVAADEALTPSLEFTETMKGYWAPSSSDDFAIAAAEGKKNDSAFQFTLTVLAHDANALLSDPEHPASMFGTVDAPQLCAEPLTVTEGKFNLFTEYGGAVDERRMRYRMTMRAPDGRSWYMDGFKSVKDGSLLRMWPDTSTLYITIYEGESETGAVVGRGILHIAPLDFQKQLGTMKVRFAKDAAERLNILYGFGRLFAGVLYETYGGIAGETSTFHPQATPRKRRTLALGAPEAVAFAADDGTELMLTRYKGGTKGPLIMAPGFGMPASAFLIDTVDRNVTEVLYAEGYDMFLFDYRSSTALPSSSQPYAIDDVARRDWPAAVAKVREVTGAPDVQVLGHCVGSMSFLMAQLAGLEGVQSAVCSALTVHPNAPTLTDLKAKLHLPSVLTALGIDKLTTEVPDPKWYDKALNQVMRLYPTTEQCHLAFCRRVLFMYGEVYRHDNINEATHEAMHEWFGVAHMKAFAQLAESSRLGHVVDANDGDTYMPHVARLAIPITFLQGEKNNMFLPIGSKRTYDWLAEHNGAEHYKRVVLPGYAHLDVLFGKDASRDVLPTIVSELARLRAMGSSAVKDT